MTTGAGLPSAGRKRFALRVTPSRIGTARSRSNITSTLISAPPMSLSLMKVSAQPYARPRPLRDLLDAQEQWSTASKDRLITVKIRIADTHDHQLWGQKRRLLVRAI